MLASLEVPGKTDDGGAIQFSMQSRTKSSLTRTLFQFFRCDIDAGSEAVQVEFLIDDVVRYRKTITGARTRKLLRFPDNLIGNTWGWRTTYQGAAPIAIYSVEVMGIDLLYA